MTTYRKSMSEALNQVYLGEDNMALLKKAAGGSAQKLKMKDGKVTMDSFTASAIMQVYKAINPKNKKTMENVVNTGTISALQKLQSLAMRAIKSGDEVEHDGEELDEVAARGKKYDDSKIGVGTPVEVKDKSGKAHKGRVVKVNRKDDKVSVSIDAFKGRMVTLSRNSPQISIVREEVELNEDGHTDVASAVRKCMTITEDAQDINSKLQTMSTEDSLPSWWTNKLAVASNDMNKMRDYIVNPVQEEVELDEAKYDLYHKDFSSAMQHSYKMAKKMYGITIDPKEIDDKVASGPRKPTEGKTNKYRLKGDKGAIQVQVYNKGGSKPFELNMYKEEVELDEKIQDIPDKKLKFYKSVPHPSYTRKEIEDEILRRKKTGDSVKEEVELDEAVKVGDTVTVKLNRKGKEYIEKGKVIKIEKDSIIVKHDFSRTPSRVSMKNIVKEEVELDESKKALKAKSEKSGVSVGILSKVYDRGMAAYKTGHRPGTTPQQWALARVNSFLTGGGARKADADLWKQAKGQKEEVELDEKVKEYKGVAYFKDRKDAEAHMKKFAPKGRVREYDRGYAIQTKIAGPYLNKSGKVEEQVDLDEGKMSQLHQLMKDGKSAKEIAKIMKVDVKTIKALMDEQLKESSARRDAMRAMGKDKGVDPADVDTDATDDDVKAASKNIMMQMRKVISLRGNFKVEFGDKKKMKIDPKIASAVQNKYDSIKRPMDKQKFTIKIAKSYKDMLSALKEGFASDAQRRAAFASGYKEKGKKKKEEIVKEGTWGLPDTPELKAGLKKLMKKPIPLGKDGDDAIKAIGKYIGDDGLYDDLYDAGKKDGPKADARPVISGWMDREFVGSWKKYRLVGLGRRHSTVETTTILDRIGQKIQERKDG